MITAAFAEGKALAGRARRLEGARRFSSVLRCADADENHPGQAIQGRLIRCHGIRCVQGVVASASKLLGAILGDDHGLVRRR
jgi:hypothetical protein